MCRGSRENKGLDSCYLSEDRPHRLQSSRISARTAALCRRFCDTIYTFLLIRTLLFAYIWNLMVRALVYRFCDAI